jgi:hypothetical protein
MGCVRNRAAVVLVFGLLSLVSLSDQAFSLFKHYLSDRTQCAQFDGNSSDMLTVQKGVPHGSVLGPLLFTIYINNVGRNVSNASYHFYADDTVTY